MGLAAAKEPSEGELAAAEVDSWSLSPAGTPPLRTRRVTASALPTAAVAATSALAVALAVTMQPPPPPQPLSQPLSQPQPQPAPAPVPALARAALARQGFVVLQGHCSLALRLQALQLASHVDWLLPERLLAGQLDRRRLRCYIEPPGKGEQARAPLPGGAAELAAECRATLGSCMRSLLGHTELYQPTVLLTLPGARQQHWHRDADQDDVYSMLIAVTDRDFCFKEAGPVHLRAGDVLIFKGSMCHAGAELTRDAAEASIAVHLYGGKGVTADVLASIFTDLACH